MNSGKMDQVEESKPESDSVDTIQHPNLSNVESPPTTSRLSPMEKRLPSIMKSPGKGKTSEGTEKKKRKKMLRFEPRKKMRTLEDELEGGTDDEEQDEELSKDMGDGLFIPADDVFVSDESLEKKLEENAVRNNLSATNVKSIIRVSIVPCDRQVSETVPEGYYYIHASNVKIMEKQHCPSLL